jgi:hypothetical protein
MISDVSLALALTADRDSFSQSRCLAKISSIPFYPEASSPCLLSSRDVRKEEPPEHRKSPNANYCSRHPEPILLEMPPWSFDAATKIKSDTVQPDRWPSFITNRLARRYAAFKP